ncbi:MAG: hypothetical protein JWM68_3027, partial [Verrucomicrobiales bacterium]|nr:hypothetical protein [Verrucomicrobiales bacterium]
QTATVTNKTYPYTSSAGNFSVAPDGALWTCSGFASYAYRSTNGGRSYTAFDINARVPTNYIPFINGQTTFGKVFSIVATPKNEIIVGTETGGYLHSTNNGQTWTSLDPNFTSTNSLNPLGHIGNAMVIGYDRYANVLCQNGEFSSPFAGATNWINIKLIEYRPSDGSYFKADNNIPSPLFPPQILTTISGDSFTFMNQNWLLEGGIYRSSDGRHWTQFNEGIPALTLPFAPGITNAVAPGNCMTAAGTVLFVGTGTGQIYRFDSTPPPITNHPPIALPQCLNVTGGASTNFILSASDADNDPLTFSITTPPQHGFLTGTPPDLTYTPTNGFIGLDGFYFDVSDEMATSPPVIVNIAVNFATNPIPQILLSIPNTRACVIAPTNITLVAVATDSDGIRRVDFDVETGRIASITNPPYTFVWTNPPAGTYTLAARAVDNLGARAWSAPLTISVLPLPLQTTIQTGSSNLFFVSWPLVFNNALLEFSTNVNGPWALVSTAPLDRNYSEHVVTLTNDLPAQFFRLFATP